MASDDKTIFNPGGAFPGDGNSTVMIPNPGGRLRPETQERSAAPPPPAPSRERLPAAFQSEARGQANPILAASNTLIAVLSAVSNSLSHPNIPQLQQELATEIGKLDNRLKQRGVSSEEALTARYILCTAIDEAVMNTPWGADSGWGQRSLLRVYHNEASGGERFFTLLDQLMGRPNEYRNLLELFYVLLSMGFKGRYQLDRAGDARLETLREQLYQTLYGQEPYDRALSARGAIDETARQKLRHRLPLWVVLAVCLALVVLVYTGLRAWMYAGTVDVVESFDELYPHDTQP